MTQRAGPTFRPVTVGVFYALAAFLFWGANPIYFKAVAGVPALEVLAHRVVWAVLFLAALTTWAQGWREIGRVLKDRRTLAYLVLTTGIISINWLIYIWAIAEARVLETSLGYFINPLVNVLLGVILLRERIGPWRSLAVILAAIGVLHMTLRVDGLPWVALSLAFTFGFYGLIRKLIRVEAVAGLFIETTMLLPLALSYLGYLFWAGQGTFLNASVSLDLLLLLAGPVTALPLIWFTAAARRLEYSTIGFFQYIAPSCQFLLAVVVYGESFTRDHLISFVLIWCALAIFAWRTLVIEGVKESQPASVPK